MKPSFIFDVNHQGGMYNANYSLPYTLHSGLPPDDIIGILLCLMLLELTQTMVEQV